MEIRTELYNNPFYGYLFYIHRPGVSIHINTSETSKNARALFGQMDSIQKILQLNLRPRQQIVNFCLKSETQSRPISRYRKISNNWQLLTLSFFEPKKKGKQTKKMNLWCQYNQSEGVAKVTCIEIKLRAFLCVCHHRVPSYFTSWMLATPLSFRHPSIYNWKCAATPTQFEKEKSCGNSFFFFFGTRDASIHSNSLWAYLLYSRWLKWFDSLMDVNWRTYTSSKQINSPVLTV